MKFVGGHDILLEGNPSGEITGHAKPDVLHVPLFSRFFNFSALQVENGETVKQGQILAEDPDNYSVPLLAPMDGTVNLEAVEYHVTLDNLSFTPGQSIEMTDAGDKRQTLLRLGVWSFMRQVSNGRVPDPTASPEVLIIPVARFEPFFPSPDVFLMDAVDRFADGLKLIHETLDGVQVHLVVPEAMPGIGRQLGRIVEENSDWAKLVEVPEHHPNDYPALVAQLLELDPDTVWALDAQAVLGAEQALAHSTANVMRVVSVSGPAAVQPSHYQVPLGYPLSSLVAPGDPQIPLRIIDGGVLTGRAIGAEQKGLDAECQALTVLQENTEREVLAFAQPGFGKQSYTRTFASLFKPLFRERLTTALRGEARPCIFCGNCEGVCPAGLIPHLIYRYLDNDREEDAQRVGLQQCVECGLCSYVCTSKIEHLDVFQAAKANHATESVDG